MREGNKIIVRRESTIKTHVKDFHKINTSLKIDIYNLYYSMGKTKFMERYGVSEEDIKEMRNFKKFLFGDTKAKGIEENLERIFEKY